MTEAAAPSAVPAAAQLGQTRADRFARWRRGEAARGLTLVSPALIYALLLLAAPMGMIVALSFATQTYLTIDWSPSLANYHEAWIDPQESEMYRALMGRSLAISGAVTAITVLLAFPIAYFVSFHVAPRRKALWIFLITIPFWTSYLLRVFLWKVILQENGVVNSILMGAGVIDTPLDMLFSPDAIIITLAHAWAPFAILPIYVALEKIDRSLLEAARDLGENRIVTFWRVTLPLALPGVVAAALIVFIPTIGDYVTPALIGGGRVPMIANMIQAQFMVLNNRPMGAALAISAMVVVAVIAILFLLLNRRFLKVRQ
ncbi:MAG TPA: ABC transporter permease [Rhodobacteraceae bacterium]|jgi:spermidine/putrescine transport system permease protein|nr:ABC transporter permease [Paracoccaceae bacterium]HBG99110.1 ABC transporter permease [Paracoccaceae bacterium]